MEARRGKYWKPNPERLKKAEEKRERRQFRNIRREFAKIVTSGTRENPGSIRLVPKTELR